MPDAQEHDLPSPAQISHAIGGLELEMTPLETEDLLFQVRRPPGGTFQSEIELRFEYGHRECREILCLDTEATRALRDALTEVLSDE